MLRKLITYKDLNGETATTEVYFNLSKAELIKLEMTEDFSNKLKRIGSSSDSKEIYNAFEEIIDMSYGVKTADGKSFIKDPAALKAFKQTEAFSELMYSFFIDEAAAAEFANGLLPEGLLAEAQAVVAAQGTTVETASAPVLEGNAAEVTSEPIVQKQPSEMTREELLAAFKEKTENNAAQQTQG